MKRSGRRSLSEQRLTSVMAGGLVALIDVAEKINPVAANPAQRYCCDRRETLDEAAAELASAPDAIARLDALAADVAGLCAALKYRLRAAQVRS